MLLDKLRLINLIYDSLNYYEIINCFLLYSVYIFRLYLVSCFPYYLYTYLSLCQNDVLFSKVFYVF